MAHEIDINNGVASFANSRSDAWHRLGQSVGHAMTAREALEAAHLNFQVSKMPLVIPQEPVITEDGVTTPDPIPVPDMFATVRNNPIIAGRVDYLGVVGSKYEPVQNDSDRARCSTRSPTSPARTSKQPGPCSRGPRNLRHDATAQDDGSTAATDPKIAPTSTSPP